MSTPVPDGLPTGSAYPILSSEHALQAGMVWGLAMKHGLDLLPVLDGEGNYSAEVEVVLPLETTGGDRTVRVRLVVQPPTPPAEEEDPFLTSDAYLNGI